MTEFETGGEIARHPSNRSRAINLSDTSITEIFTNMMLTEFFPIETPPSNVGIVEENLVDYSNLYMKEHERMYPELDDPQSKSHRATKIALATGALVTIGGLMFMHRSSRR